MAKRKPVIDIEDCTRLIEKRRYRDAVYAFEEILDKLIEAKKSPRGSQVAKELKKLVTAIEDSFKRSYYESDSEQDQQRKPLVCSFCGKSQDEVRKLIAGPTVYICNECIDLCNDIIRDEADFDQPVSENAAEPKETRQKPICALCTQPRGLTDLVHIAAGMRLCTVCLEAIHTVTEQREKK